jgi:hypothetical protein
VYCKTAVLHAGQRLDGAAAHLLRTMAKRRSDKSAYCYVFISDVA